jgi:hypothetical protein
MTYPSDLTEDQQKRIEATLARIRGGLGALTSELSDEPAHIFVLEALDEDRK